MKPTPGRILFIGWIAVTATIEINRRLTPGLTIEEINAYFTGLGFVGLLATLWHEREQAEGADQEHAQLLNMMKQQVIATGHATRVAALTARLESSEELYDQLRASGGMTERALELRKNTAEEIRQIKAALKDASERMPPV